MPDQHHTTRNSPIGVFWSFLSAFLWSTTFIGARYLLARGAIDPVSLSAVRFSIGGGVLCLAAMIYLRREFFAISRADYLRLAMLGLFGVAGMSGFLFIGQQTTTAINSSILMQLSPVVTLLLGPLIGERITAGRASGILCSFLGSLLVVGVISIHGIRFESGHLAGDGFVLLSAICWAIYTVLAKPVVDRLGGLRAAAWSMVFGAAELWLLQALLPAPAAWPQAQGDWTIILYLAIFPTGLAFLAWYQAMHRISLSLLNVMQYLTAFFTILLAWLLLGERMGWEALFGFVLVLAGLALVEKAPRRGRPRLRKMGKPVSR